MKKAFGTLANLALAISVLLLVAVLLAPALIGLSLEPILGGSMEPTIGTGALIAIGKVAPEEVQVGDVIGFKVEGMDTPVCHRVIEIVDTEEAAGFRTKGDANEDPDTWIVKPENLIGKVVLDLPGLGYTAKFIKTPYGFGLLLGLPAILIIALETRSMFWAKPNRRKRPKLRQKSSQFPAYLSIITGLIFIGVLWGMMAGNTQEKTLASFAERSEEVNQPLYVSQRNMQNKGVLPLVICLFSEDETVSFSDNCFPLSPGRQKEIEISGDSETAAIKTGCFFPLLPQKTLYQLFTWDSRFASLIAAAVWIFPVTIIAFLVLRGFPSKPNLAQRAKYIKGMLSYG
jgi:signal peptidase